MAMMDNRAFLVSHIRNSFITSDDTGMCELIIENDEHVERSTDKRPATWHNNRVADVVSSSLSDSGMDSDGELSQSYDILPDMDFAGWGLSARSSLVQPTDWTTASAGHRRRSNTALRLERLKKEKHKQSKIKHIQWKDVDHNMEEISEHFEKKLLGTKKQTVNRTSMLSEQLEKFAAIPNNPFSDFAKFDGQASAGIPTKKIDIFLTMANEKERPFPMTVITMATAKVQDLIGLICWQYTNQGRQPTLNSNLEAYSLHIAEDDGEVDEDFPALDNKEPISKFGFAKLALVVKDIGPPTPKSSLIVTVNMPNGAFSQVEMETDSTPLREVLERIIKRRKRKTAIGLEYKLEKLNDPGNIVDLDLPLSTFDTRDFYMLRHNSTRTSVDTEDIPSSMSALAESLSSHQYRSYRVSMAHKLRTNTDVQLGISGEKIEIDPVSSKGILFRQKAVTYDTEDIGACTMLDEKSSNSQGKSLFRLVYLSPAHDYKHHDFESDSATAKEIVNKINNILEMRSSPTRKDYLAFRERKTHKRYSSHS